MAICLHYGPLQFLTVHPIFIAIPGCLFCPNLLPLWLVAIIINLLFTSVVCLTGTYGTVFKAKNRETQEIVALKRVRLDDDDEVSSSADLFLIKFLK